MDEQALKNTVASNLAAYRKAMKWTQSELAAKLNYSDKAVSKWERAESLPDFFVLKQIADLFGVSLDDLCRDYGNRKIRKPSRIFKKRILIPLMAVGIVWLVATNVFVILTMIGAGRAYLAFLAAVPVSMIVLVVFSTLWWKPILTAIFISGIVWSIVLFLYVVVNNERNWMFFILAVPLQILEILWSIHRKPPRAAVKEKSTPAETMENKSNDS